MSHPVFNMPKGIVIDVLHALFLGVVLLLAKYWFSPKHSRMPFSIRKKVRIGISMSFEKIVFCIILFNANVRTQVLLCDKRLLALKIPDFISRRPKSLLEVTHWKGVDKLCAFIYI